MKTTIFTKILQILFFISTFLILLGLGWYTELAVWSDYGRFYEILNFLFFCALLAAIIVHFLFQISINNLVRKSLAALLVGSLVFLSGAQIYRTNFVGINHVLELSVYGFRETFVGHIILNVKSLLESENPQERIVSVESHVQTEAKLANDFDHEILVKFGTQPVFTASNIDRNGPKITSLTSIDPTLSLRPFAFSNANTFVAYTESKTESGLAANTEQLILFKRDKPDNNFHIAWKISTTAIPHHWGDIYNGEIYIPGKRNSLNTDTFRRKFQLSSYSHCENTEYFVDTIEVFSLKDGTHIRTIEILPLLAKYPHESFARFLNICDDPTHLNDVQVLTSEQVERGWFPNGSQGDLLISMREINSLALIDKTGKELKWVSSKFEMQHSPRITSRGTILVFDNRASNSEYGSSRITELDISDNKIIGIWEGANNSTFQSMEGGRLQLFGDKLFIQESDAGNVFELVCSENRISMECKPRLIFHAPYKNMYIGEILR